MRVSLKPKGGHSKVFPFFCTLRGKPTNKVSGGFSWESWVWPSSACPPIIRTGHRGATRPGRRLYLRPKQVAWRGLCGPGGLPAYLLLSFSLGSFSFCSAPLIGGHLVFSFLVILCRLEQDSHTAGNITKQPCSLFMFKGSPWLDKKWTHSKAPNGEEIGPLGS